MSNALKRLLDLLPKAPEFVGEITSADHPKYKVLVVDGTGLVMCTSSTKYAVGTRVFVSNQEIKRVAPSGAVVQIEI
ncbi:hypothetical protein SE27_08125 [Acinetobacter harbinensis]|uniref:hypothetical protein n=1 Tax=Acinetobacter harbinensis TaxID=1353941 RepID=UPI00057D03E0|nr:hypothetical protein [Acinetobacter harbinensis]KWQ05225.1 hypothetical protein SE27_08125 [Acinetobacter harbinensis]